MQNQLKHNETIELASSSKSIMQVENFFEGVFEGSNVKIRVTPDKKHVSVYDVIQFTGRQKNPHKTWGDIQNSNTDVLTFCKNFKFPGQGQKLTPVINAKGLVLLLNQIPGEKARLFRLQYAEILVRYLGGDLSLINEIKAIDQLHRETSQNAAQIFRNDETVQQNLQFFTDDQRNNSNRLIAHFANKLDTFYGILFYRQETLMFKIGCAPIRTFELRQKDHKSGKSGLIKNTDEMCYSFVFQMKDPFRVESEFKATKFYQDNKVDIANEKDESKKVTEVFLLNETLTSELVKEQVMNVAADRILDPPSYATVIHVDLEIERERTKQRELDKSADIEKMKIQVELKKLAIEEKRLDLEMLKFNVLRKENPAKKVDDDVIENINDLDVITEGENVKNDLLADMEEILSPDEDDKKKMEELENQRITQDFHNFLDKSLRYKENYVAGYVDIVDNYFGKESIPKGTFGAVKNYSQNKEEFRNKIIEYLKIRGLDFPYAKYYLTKEIQQRPNFKNAKYLSGFKNCLFTPVERKLDTSVIMKTATLVSIVETLFEKPLVKKRQNIAEFFPVVKIIGLIHDYIIKLNLDTFEHRNVSFVPLQNTKNPKATSNNFGFSTSFVNDALKVINDLGFKKCKKPHGYYMNLILN